MHFEMCIVVFVYESFVVKRDPYNTTTTDFIPTSENINKFQNVVRISDVKRIC